MRRSIKRITSLTLVTLKKRAEFLRLRGGSRFATPSFVLETKPRSISPGFAEDEVTSGPRFGFTITKKLGKAVVRNRIRRRLKAAVTVVAPEMAKPNHDYVIVARSEALVRGFADLKKDLERALQRVHHPASGPRAPGKRG